MHGSAHAVVGMPSPSQWPMRAVMLVSGCRSCDGVVGVVLSNTSAGLAAQAGFKASVIAAVLKQRTSSRSPPMVEAPQLRAAAAAAVRRGCFTSVAGALGCCRKAALQLQRGTFNFPCRPPPAAPWKALLHSAACDCCHRVPVGKHLDQPATRPAATSIAPDWNSTSWPRRCPTCHNPLMIDRRE